MPIAGHQPQFIALHLVVAVGVRPGEPAQQTVGLLLRDFGNKPPGGLLPGPRQFVKWGVVRITPDRQHTQSCHRAQQARRFVHLQQQAKMSIGPEIGFLLAVALQIQADRDHPPGHLVMRKELRIEFRVPSIAGAYGPVLLRIVDLDLHQVAPVAVHPDQRGIFGIRSGEGVELLAAVPFAQELAVAVETRGAARRRVGLADHESAVAVAINATHVLEILRLIKPLFPSARTAQRGLQLVVGAKAFDLLARAAFHDPQGLAGGIPGQPRRLGQAGDDRRAGTIAADFDNAVATDRDAV